MTGAVRSTESKTLSSHSSLSRNDGRPIIVPPSSPSSSSSSPPPPPLEASSFTREIIANNGIRLIIDVEDDGVDETSSGISPHRSPFLFSSSYACEIDPTTNMIISLSNSSTLSAIHDEKDVGSKRTESKANTSIKRLDDEAVRMHKRKLILIMTSPRSGSSFLNWIFRSIQRFTNRRDLDLFPADEVFTRTWVYWQHPILVRDVLLPICAIGDENISHSSADLLREEWRDLHTHMEEATTRDNFTESLLYLASKKSSPPWFRRLVELMNKEKDVRGRPVEILQYLRSIPAFSTNASNSHLVIKFHDYHQHLINTTFPFPVNNMSKTINPKQPSLVTFFDMVRHVWKGRYEDIKVIVLWRRSFFDHYVSYKIANQLQVYAATEGNATGKNSSKPKANIVIHQRELKKAFRFWIRYNKLVHEVLSSRPIEYTVVEYEDDLRNRTNQKETTKRLLDFLGVTMDKLQIPSSENRNEDTVLDALIDSVLLKKQSQTPIEEQISNWDEVSQWNDAAMKPVTGSWERRFSNMP